MLIVLFLLASVAVPAAEDWQAVRRARLALARALLFRSDTSVRIAKTGRGRLESDGERLSLREESSEPRIDLARLDVFPDPKDWTWGVPEYSVNLTVRDSRETDLWRLRLAPVNAHRIASFDGRALFLTASGSMWDPIIDGGTQGDFGTDQRAVRNHALRYLGLSGEKEPAPEAQRIWAAYRRAESLVTARELEVPETGISIRRQWATLALALFLLVMASSLDANLRRAVRRGVTEAESAWLPLEVDTPLRRAASWALVLVLATAPALGAGLITYDRLLHAAADGTGMSPLQTLGWGGGLLLVWAAAAFVGVSIGRHFVILRGHALARERGT